jgi:hypothetical protein
MITTNNNYNRLGVIGELGMVDTERESERCKREMMSRANKNKENITQSWLYFKLKHVVLSQAHFNSNSQKYHHT